MAMGSLHHPPRHGLALSDESTPMLLYRFSALMQDSVPFDQ
jgi:hypothetical protein